MVKRLTFFVSILFLATSVSPANAFWDRDVKKSKEFMQAGMYPQAIELLNKRITDKPTDAEAHYLLGTCYMKSGNYGAAEQRFLNAVRLKADYGNQIGGEFKTAGSDALSKGQVEQAQGLFAKAVEYQPNLKNEVATECLAAGKSYLNRGQVQQAQALLARAVQYQPDLKKEVAGEYLGAGKLHLSRGQSSVADGLFSMAVGYDGTLSDEVNKVRTDYGMKLLETAKAKPKEERKKYIEEAKKYVEQKIIDQAFPPPSWKTVFEKTYTFDDAITKDGWIQTIKFGADDVKIGDTIEVITTLLSGEKFSGQEISIYRGEGFHPVWITTTGGFYRVKVETFEPGKYFALSTYNRKDVKITVRAKRLVESY